MGNLATGRPATKWVAIRGRSSSCFFFPLKPTRSLEVFAGGPLAKKTGDALVAAGVKLSSVYGATEFAPITYTFRSRTEQTLWEWVRFGPNQRIRWVAQRDGTYECQVLVRVFGLRFERSALMTDLGYRHVQRTKCLSRTCPTSRGTPARMHSSNTLP